MQNPTMYCPIPSFTAHQWQENVLAVERLDAAGDLTAGESENRYLEPHDGGLSASWILTGDNSSRRFLPQVFKVCHRTPNTIKHFKPLDSSRQFHDVCCTAAEVFWSRSWPEHLFARFYLLSPFFKEHFRIKCFCFLKIILLVCVMVSPPRS